MQLTPTSLRSLSNHRLALATAVALAMGITTQVRGDLINLTTLLDSATAWNGRLEDTTLAAAGPFTFGQPAGDAVVNWTVKVQQLSIDATGNNNDILITVKHLISHDPAEGEGIEFTGQVLNINPTAPFGSFANGSSLGSENHGSHKDMFTEVRYAAPRGANKGVLTIRVRHVPDTGSTLLCLGVACGIFAIARSVRPDSSTAA